MNLFTLGDYLIKLETICVFSRDCGKIQALDLRRIRQDRINDPQQGQVP